MKSIKKILPLISLFFVTTSVLFANPFNSKLTDTEKQKLDNGEILIKKINYSRNMCLENGVNDLSDTVIKKFKDLSPKYLAEIIQIKPIKGNEDLPERLAKLLYNVPNYAGIPYYSERAEAWYDLYSSATITEEKGDERFKELWADIEMTPFGIIKQYITIQVENDAILYDSINLNKLRYYDDFDCVWPKKLKLDILLFKDGENWILYGIGGVNAPRIPFFTERIDTSFINRIKTFCNYIFEKLDEKEE